MTAKACGVDPNIWGLYIRGVKFETFGSSIYQPEIMCAAIYTNNLSDQSIAFVFNIIYVLIHISVKTDVAPNV